MSELIELSAIDHMCIYNAGSIELVFHYRGDLDTDRLVESFYKTAKDFLGVAACVVEKDAHTLAYDLSLDLAEIRVISAPGDSPLSECVDSAEFAFGAPLTRARVTKLADNGTAIALSMSHAVADGYSFFLFVAAWAARAAGRGFPKPNCDRTPLSRPTVRAPSTAGATDLRAAGLVLLDDAPSQVPLPWVERTLSAAWLQQLKREAVGHGLSLNDFLCATFWKESLQDSTASEVMLAVPVDLRRHSPALGPLFFGNADLHASVRVSPEALREASVPEVGRWVRSAIESLPKQLDPALESLERLRASHGLTVLPRVCVCPPATGLLVSNISRIPLEPLDFGAGPPASIARSSLGPTSRTCFLMAGSGGDAQLFSSAP